MTWAFRPWTPAEQAQLAAGTHLMEYDYRKGIAGLTVRVRPCSDFPAVVESAPTPSGAIQHALANLRRARRDGRPAPDQVPISVAEARKRGFIK